MPLRHVLSPDEAPNRTAKSHEKTAFHSTNCRASAINLIIGSGSFSHTQLAYGEETEHPPSFPLSHRALRTAKRGQAPHPAAM
jgi:hypothetical protein